MGIYLNQPMWSMKSEGWALHVLELEVKLRKGDVLGDVGFRPLRNDWTAFVEEADLLVRRQNVKIFRVAFGGRDGLKSWLRRIVDDDLGSTGSWLLSITLEEAGSSECC